MIYEQSDSAASVTVSSRMRVLFVLSSTNQLYSGIGRNIFELCRRQSGQILYEFAIDDFVPKNVQILSEYCQSENFNLHVGRGHSMKNHPDAYNADLRTLLAEGHWDFLECVAWANAATNREVLRAAKDVPVAYTPHYQPAESISPSADQKRIVESVHLGMLNRSRVVFCDSPWEQSFLGAQFADKEKFHYLPIGCDFDSFIPGAVKRRPELLFVGDLREPRKRFDRVLDLLQALRSYERDLSLTVIGSGQESLQPLVPPELREHVSCRGYVSEAELRRSYRESALLLVLSDSEAFCIPVLEALASGTPVCVARQASIESVFGGFPGVYLCDPDDLGGATTTVQWILQNRSEAISETISARPQLMHTFAWDALAAKKWRALASGWFFSRYA